LLGFNVKNQRRDPDFAYMENGKVQIMLEQIHEVGWVTGQLEYPLGRGVNFQMELETISPVLERLKASNVSLYREQQENWYDQGDMLSGQREFLVQDPDGYLLRFIQYLGEKSK